MRNFLYLQLQQKLAGLAAEDGSPMIRTFDLWNEQVDFVEEEEPFARPAVFLEFLPCKWNTLGGSVQQASASIRLHIVTDWGGSSRQGSPWQQQSLGRLDLVERISSHLHDFRAKDERTDIDLFRRTASHTNHNHGELVEDIEEYTFRATQRI